jgi:hypothetical protein
MLINSLNLDIAAQSDSVYLGSSTVGFVGFVNLKKKN